MPGLDCDIGRRGRVRRRRWWRWAAAPATWTLVGVNLAFYAADCLSSGTGSVHSVGRWAGIDPKEVWAGAWWRLFTHAFVHSGPSHLIWNLAYLVPFGCMAERAIGGFRLLQVYFLTTLAAALVCMLHDPVRSLGASAAIYGIQGVYVALLWRIPRFRLSLGPSCRRWLWTIFTVWCVMDTWGAPGIGYVAHLVGLVAGLWYGSTLSIRRWAPRRVVRRLRVRYAALLGGIAAAGFLVAAAVWEPNWWCVRAKQAARSGDWATAHRQLRALEQRADPDLDSGAHALLWAANLYLEQGHKLRARALLERAVRTLDHPWFFAKLGYLQAYVPPYKEREGIGNLRMAVAEDSTFVPALVEIAWLELTADDSTLHNPEQALKLAKRAVDLNGGLDPSYLLVLAEAHLQCGDRKEAVRLAEAALRLHPKNRAFYEEELARMKAAEE